MGLLFLERFSFLDKLSFLSREIYIFPWLQVRITGPRNHLTSSLRNYAQGYDKTGRYLQYVFKYGLQGTLPGLVHDSVGSAVARAL